MKRHGTAVFVLSVLLVSGAQAFAASSWGLINEEEVRFDGKVVDVLATLTGSESPDCGGGKRQLGILKDDGTLVLTGKNTLNFTGTTNELVEYCGQQVTVDGLISGHSGATFMVVQFVRPQGGEWRGANRSIGQWSKEGWAKANGYDPAGAEVKRWFEHDKRVLEALEANGFLGIGKEADEAYLKE